MLSIYNLAQILHSPNFKKIFKNSHILSFVNNIRAQISEKLFSNNPVQFSNSPNSKKKIPRNSIFLRFQYEIRAQNTEKRNFWKRKIVLICAILIQSRKKFNIFKIHKNCLKTYIFWVFWMISGPKYQQKEKFYCPHAI